MLIKITEKKLKLDKNKKNTVYINKINLIDIKKFKKKYLTM